MAVKIQETKTKGKLMLFRERRQPDGRQQRANHCHQWEKVPLCFNRTQQSNT